jgi:predicted  nucleic acid-binding Zn-ribbon protein
MPQQTSMTIYRDVVLECQHCYMICRYSDAEVRQSCPSCGRNISNWTAIMEALRKDVPESPHRTAVAPDTISTSPKSNPQARD